MTMAHTEIHEIYNKMNLHDKQLMFELILEFDTLIFNTHYKTLEDSARVCHVGKNGTMIQLSINQAVERREKEDLPPVYEEGQHDNNDTTEEL